MSVHLLGDFCKSFSCLKIHNGPKDRKFDFGKFPQKIGEVMTGYGNILYKEQAQKWGGGEVGKFNRAHVETLI